MKPSIDDEIAAFRHAAAATLDGVKLIRATNEIDEVENRWKRLGRDPAYGVPGNEFEDLLAMRIHCLRALVAEVDGLPVPRSPSHEIDERRAAYRAAAVAKRLARVDPPRDPEPPYRTYNDRGQLTLF